MKEFSCTIKDPLGIHARPAGMLAKEAKLFSSTITVTNNDLGKEAKASQLMKLMGLGVKQGASVTVKAEGDDEDAAIAAMEEFFKANL